jgi:N-methylhydantoinase B
VRGGEHGQKASTYKISRNGDREKLPNVIQMDFMPGELLMAIDNGGGGYGNPLERDTDRVLHDVRENWESLERARDVYGVVITGTIDGENLAVNQGATDKLRAQMATQ